MFKLLNCNNNSRFRKGRSYFYQLFLVNMKLKTKIPSSYQQGVSSATTVPRLNMFSKNSDSQGGKGEDFKYCTKLTRWENKSRSLLHVNPHQKNLPIFSVSFSKEPTILFLSKLIVKLYNILVIFTHLYHLDCY